MVHLDNIDFKIIKLMEVNPRNVTWIAKQLELPLSTVRYKFFRLLKLGTIVRPYIDFPKMGLYPLSCFFFKKSHLESLTKRLLLIRPYVRAVGSLYSMTGDKIIYIKYLVPKEMAEGGYFERYFKQLAEEGAIDGYLAYKVHEYKFAKGYNYKKLHNAKSFNVDVERGSKLKDRKLTYFHQNLIGNKKISIPDRIDLEIIKALEENPLMKLIEIARRINVSLQVVRYHYCSHILGKGFLRGFKVLAPLPPNFTFKGIFVLKFDNLNDLYEFITLIERTPFIESLEVSLSDVVLIWHYRMFGFNQLRKCLQLLTKLKDVGKVRGILGNFIKEELKRYNIDPVLFKGDRWRLDFSLD